MTKVLKREIERSGLSLSELCRQTGLQPASLMRFLRGEQSIRLDLADRLAKYFELELRKRK